MPHFQYKHLVSETWILDPYDDLQLPNNRSPLKSFTLASYSQSESMCINRSLKTEKMNGHPERHKHLSSENVNEPKWETMLEHTSPSLWTSSIWLARATDYCSGAPHQKKTVPRQTYLTSLTLKTTSKWHSPTYYYTETHNTTHTPNLLEPRMNCEGSEAARASSSSDAFNAANSQQHGVKMAFTSETKLPRGYECEFCLNQTTTKHPESKKLVPVLKVVASIRWDVVWAFVTPLRALRVINTPLNVTTSDALSPYSRFVTSLTVCVFLQPDNTFSIDFPSPQIRFKNLVL